MKKLNYLVLGLAGLAMASCSQEEVSSPGVNGSGNVQFKVTLPKDMTTRADIGTGLEATQLYALAYETTTAEDATTSNTYLFTAEASFPTTGNQLQTTINMELLPGKSYNIVFFAGAPSVSEVLEPSDTDSESTAVYSINASTGALTVNYSKMEAPGEDTQDLYDCFYTVYPISNLTLTGVSANVELKRPVAQVNWGTTMPSETANTNFDDVLGENGEYIATDFTATGVPSQLNLLTGATTSTANVSWSKWGMPEDATYPDISGATESYTYLAMQYLLAPASSSANIDMTLTVTNANPNAPTTIAAYSNTINVSSAPVQANYQTNIYGSLLTSGADFNVEIKPGFGGTTPIEVNGKWDGSTVTIPVIPEKPTDTPIPLTTPAELAGLAALVNGTNGQTASDLEGYTFELSTDMDMDGNSLSIGSASRSDGEANGNAFRGTFDGNGHTISNLKLSASEDADKNDVVALIPNLDGTNAEVKNLNFENLVIDGGNVEQASVIGLISGGAKVSGITVNSGSITATEGAAGIVGRVLGSGTITGCTNSANITVTTETGGGIVGAAYYTESENSVQIINCINRGNVVAENDNSSIKNQTVGGIVGTSGATITGCINYGNIGSMSMSTVGGIVGIQYSCGTISNCQNYGDVQGSSNVGGILGWAGNNPYGYISDIVLDGNTNYGNLKSNGNVGGIMSINRATVNLSNNTNKATSITGGTPAGIASGGFAQDNPKNGGNGYINILSGNVNDLTSVPDYVGTFWENGAAVKYPNN